MTHLGWRRLSRAGDGRPGVGFISMISDLSPSLRDAVIPAHLGDFGALSEAEQRLASEANRGDYIVIENGNLPPEGASTERTIRAAFIRYLLLEGSRELRARGTRIHEKGLRVRGAVIDGVLDLESAVVPHDLRLENCRFREPPVFDSAQIEGLYLNGSVLPGLRGIWMVARGPVSLDGVEVTGEVRLVGAKIRGQLDCDDVRIENPGKNALSLTRAEVGGALFFRGKARVRGFMNLNEASFRTMVDAPECWPERGNLNLSGCLYSAFALAAPVCAEARLQWLRLQVSDETGKGFTPQPYEHCANVLERLGHAGDAKVIRIEKERLQRRAERRRARGLLKYVMWLRDCLLGATIRYGHAPMVAVVWLFGFWALGAALEGLVYQEHAFRPNISLLRRAEWMACAGTEAQTWSAASFHERLVGRAEPHESQLECFLRQPETQSYPRFDAAVYSLDTLLPVVSLGMDDYWSPDETKPWGVLGRVYLWFQIILGWALTFLTVAGFSGLVKTR
jgi:hypothetical protein